MEEIYQIAPQMREYFQVQQVWLPYILFFQINNYQSDVINTDNFGFRISYKQERQVQNFENESNLPVALLVGNSTAFGIGASSDRQTISSKLNDRSDYLWYNFSGRAYNMMQEFILFSLHHRQIRNLKKVVIFSGVNDLILFHLTGKYSADFGSFFFSKQYRKRLRDLNYTVSKRDLFDYSQEKRRSDLSMIIRRALENWKLFAKAMGFELVFVLQPYLSWTDKILSPEESQLLTVWDSMQMGYR